MAGGHTFAFTCRDTAVQSLHLPLVGWNMLQQQLHLQPSGRPLCLEPPSLEIKQERVESDYTPGTLLCPLQSDDGDDCPWIFRTLAVNILTCQRCTSPVSPPVRLYASVKHGPWPLPNCVTLPFYFLFSLSHQNYRMSKLPTRDPVKMINSTSCFWAQLMAMQPLCIQSSFLFHR